MEQFSRRTFLDIVSRAIPGLPLAALMNETASSIEKPVAAVPVALVSHENVINGDSIDQDKVLVMLDAAVKGITGMGNASDAWLSLFPGITRKSVIGIKVNCINSSLSSHPKVAMAIVNALKRMQVEGSPFSENNIIIWDRTSSELRAAGYTINTGTTGVRCFANDQSGVGYSTETYSVTGSSQRLSRILTVMCDYLVNLSVFKNHGDTGVTFSLKNHYGTCNSPSSIHRDYLDPSIPELNSLLPIRSKQVISICDALWGIVSGGPSGVPQITPKSLIVSRDPVALDTICAQELGTYGCKTLKIATYIATAAKAPYSLGVNDLSLINVLRMKNPTISVDGKESDETHPLPFQVYQNYPNPFNTATTLSFNLFRPAWVKLDIYSAEGVLVRCLSDKYLPAGYHIIFWNGLSRDGLPLASGSYFGRFLFDRHSETVRMLLLK